jgi:hypothetical protein
MRLLGYPSVPLARLVDWTADWVGRGMPSPSPALAEGQISRPIHGTGASLSRSLKGVVHRQYVRKPSSSGIIPAAGQRVAVKFHWQTFAQG